MCGSTNKTSIFYIYNQNIRVKQKKIRLWITESLQLTNLNLREIATFSTINTAITYFIIIVQPLTLHRLNEYTHLSLLDYLHTNNNHKKKVIDEYLDRQNDKYIEERQPDLTYDSRFTKHVIQGARIHPLQRHPTR